jgi:hypothetical protein
MKSILIYEYQKPHILARFSEIAPRLEPFVSDLVWAIDHVDGTMAQGAGLTLADAIQRAAETLVEPITWSELQIFARSFFQIYDCRFRGVRSSDKSERTSAIVECFDSSYWEVGFAEAESIEALTKAFGNTSLSEIT